MDRSTVQMRIVQANDGYARSAVLTDLFFEMFEEWQRTHPESSKRAEKGLDDAYDLVARLVEGRAADSAGMRMHLLSLDSILTYFHSAVDRLGAARRNCNPIRETKEAIIRTLGWLLRLAISQGMKPAELYADVATQFVTRFHFPTENAAPMNAKDEVDKRVAQLESGRLPSDEPVFFLRAEDRCAALVVRIWADMARMMDAPAVRVLEAEALADRMDKWPVKRVPGRPETQIDARSDR